MPQITITLVDHTNDRSSSDGGNLRRLIEKHIGDIFLDLLYSGSEDTGVVNTVWKTQWPVSDDQDLVLHFVEKCCQFLYQREDVRQGTPCRWRGVHAITRRKDGV